LEAGVHYFDRFTADRIEPMGPWRIEGGSLDKRTTIRADFLVDATGSESRLASVFGIPSAIDRVRTRSRAVYGHFRGVRPWTDVLDQLGVDRGEHPFPCDAAALHHVFDGGWIWVLSFDNGVTSAGFSLDPARHPWDQTEPAEREWARLMGRLPSVGAQFVEAQPVRPIVQTGRIQRRLARAAGETWACLPHAAGFVDAWLSPGIAHTLFAVERLAGVLSVPHDSAGRRDRLAAYERAIGWEFDVIDSLTAGCFAKFPCLADVGAVAMPYFAAAIYSEDRFRKGLRAGGDCFLLAHDDGFRAAAAAIGNPHGPSGTELADQVRRAIQPFNLAGLADPAKRNMYPFIST
jgi:FADH2 O2-dependent halogenase